MIPKNLKPGDVFTDGGLYYCVDAVSREGYLSHRIPEPEKETQKQAPEAGSKKVE